jgi:hypothetical protein
MLILVVRDTQKAIHLRQGVKLTGLDTETFGRAIDSIVLIHTIFSRQFKEGLWETWQPSAFGGGRAIDMSNRYFTSRRRDTQAASIPFHKDVDPEGILSEIAGADLIHCEENRVLYYEFFASEGEQNERSGIFYLD